MNTDTTIAMLRSQLEAARADFATTQMVMAIEARRANAAEHEYEGAKKLLAEARWLLENDKSDWRNGEFACCDYCDAQWSASKRDYVHKPNCEYVAWDKRLGAFLKATEGKTDEPSRG